jgi:hypothetical protein
LGQSYNDQGRRDGQGDVRPGKVDFSASADIAGQWYAGMRVCGYAGMRPLRNFGAALPITWP